MLNEAPAVWFETDPELPVPEVKVWLERVNPERTLVPDSVMLPLASGVPALGRTWMFCHWIVLAVVLAVLMVAVMVEPLAATVALKVPLTATPLMFWAAEPPA